MNAREHAMAAHPAGKGIPASAEVEQARMDDEAMTVGNSARLTRLNERHHEVSNGKHAWLLEWLPPAGISAFIIVACWLYGVAEDFFGWWPA